MILIHPFVWYFHFFVSIFYTSLKNMVTAHVTILTHILLHLYLMFLLSFHRLFYVFRFFLLLFLLHTKHNTDDDNRLLIWNDWVFYFWMKYYSEWQKKEENKKRQEILYRMHWVRFCADLLHRPVHVYLFIMHNHVLRFLYNFFCCKNIFS